MRNRELSMTLINFKRSICSDCREHVCAPNRIAVNCGSPMHKFEGHNGSAALLAFPRTSPLKVAHTMLRIEFDSFAS